MSVLPPLVCRQLFGPEEEDWVKEVELELDVWGDGWMNRHLGYRIIECIVVRILPEITEKGPRELLEERLGVGLQQ